MADEVPTKRGVTVPVSVERPLIGEWVTDRAATDPVDRVAVALIRTLNHGTREVKEDAPDWELLGAYGHAARPLAEALVEVIRDEVARATAPAE